MTTHTDTTAETLPEWAYPTREAAEAEAERRNRDERETLDCGHLSEPKLVAMRHAGHWGISGVAGYARHPETDATMCFSCADSAQAADMATADVFTAYLSRSDDGHRWTLTT